MLRLFAVLNARFALRKGRTLLSVLAIALGVGSTSAMFSATDGILLHPLPFPRSEQLVTLWANAIRWCSPAPPECW